MDAELRVHVNPGLFLDMSTYSVVMRMQLI